MGRRGPQKTLVDPVRLLALAQIHCTHGEMAAVLGMSLRTFQERLEEHPELHDIINKGRDEGKASLRRAQWKSALSGDRTMMIWLGKNHLGQRDAPLEVTGAGGGPLVILAAEPRKQYGQERDEDAA